MQQRTLLFCNNIKIIIKASSTLYKIQYNYIMMVVFGLYLLGSSFLLFAVQGGVITSDDPKQHLFRRMQDGVVDCGLHPCVDVTDPNVGGPAATFVGETVSNWDGIAVDTFLGIKYATFDERFAPSKTLLNLSGGNDGDGSTALSRAEAVDNSVLVFVNATEYGPECAQQSVPEGATYDEDCLYLNIYRPSQQEEGSSLPVMVWLHGGQWVSGSGNHFDGSNLAGSEDVIVVTINYRLGVFGYLPTGPDGMGGMNGLLDQVNALEWVKDRIGFFGGDPDRVTVFGESAGAISACFLSVCPQANGLFQRAILQSGQCVAFTSGPKTPEETDVQVNDMLQNMNCTSPPCTIEDLKSLTTEQLLDPAYYTYYPTVDNDVLPANPVELYREGKINPTDMIIGTNTVDNGDVYGALAGQDEWIEAYSDYEVLRSSRHSLVSVSDEVLSNMEAAYPPEKYGGSIVSATNHAMGDMNFLCYTRELAAMAASNVDGKIFTYIFGHNSVLDFANVTGLLNASGIDDPYWSSHGGDVPYPFGFPNEIPWLTSIPEEQVPLSREFMTRWANFAKSGNPQVTSDSSLSSSSQWEPVPNNLYDATSKDAVDPPYLNITGEGGRMVESNTDKSDQCTAVIPAVTSYFGWILDANVGSVAAGAPSMMNRVITAGWMITLLGLMMI